MRPCSIASTTFMIPAAPAAAWVCPMLDFADPITTGRSGARPAAITAPSACTSIGSPSDVPVPWHSM